jgi:hypothetical protein
MPRGYSLIGREPLTLFDGGLLTAIGGAALTSICQGRERYSDGQLSEPCQELSSFAILGPVSTFEYAPRQLPLCS